MEPPGDLEGEPVLLTASPFGTITHSSESLEGDVSRLDLCAKIYTSGKLLCMYGIDNLIYKSVILPSKKHRCCPKKTNIFRHVNKCLHHLLPVVPFCFEFPFGTLAVMKDKMTLFMYNNLTGNFNTENWHLVYNQLYKKKKDFCIP